MFRYVISIANFTMACIWARTKTLSPRTMWLSKRPVSMCLRRSMHRWAILHRTYRILGSANRIRNVLPNKLHPHWIICMQSERFFFKFPFSHTHSLSLSSAAFSCFTFDYYCMYVDCIETNDNFFF